MEDDFDTLQSKEIGEQLRAIRNFCNRYNIVFNMGYANMEDHWWWADLSTPGRDQHPPRRLVNIHGTWEQVMHAVFDAIDKERRNEQDLRD